MPASAPTDHPDLYVVARILERLWREGEPMLKTRLQVAANVNYDIFTKHLGWLLSHGLVSIQNSPDGHERVSLSRKGYEAYQRLVEWINEFVRSQKSGL